MAESGVVQILEIRDELVTCEICFEYFDDQDKSPRILPCFHSFCCRCLESIWEKSPLEACSVAVCPSCALISHRDHEIQDLKDVYQAKKDQVTAVLCDLEKSKVTSEGYKCKLVEQNEALSVIKQRCLQDIDDSYEKCITMLSERRQQLKEQVISNVAKQQADRNEKFETLTLSNDSKSRHFLYCQQALSYTRAVQFIEMSEVLEKQARRLLEIPQLLDMKMEEVDVDLDTFDQVCKILQKRAMVVDMSQIKPCIEVRDAKKGEESRVVQVAMLPKETKAEDQTDMLKAMIESDTEIKGEEKPKTKLISFGVHYVQTNMY
ncbi:E3 ubiquitin-protein ligase TRIM13-like [Gigantopelta aegis]|uniref:E3 ubiquitin-protein ligase TRIM13-like n=1 Tax=Gigantopelta aegis TaxID=1735272 RepID=UPI001B887B35|nr:E3 ubiquitin-protein ligase TRIM13-like [Gigantopelta aegis]